MVIYSEICLNYNKNSGVLSPLNQMNNSFASERVNQSSHWSVFKNYKHITLKYANLISVKKSITYVNLIKCMHTLILPRS
jgi:hypothetical protein